MAQNQELDGDALCDVVMKNFEARSQGQQHVQNQPPQSRPQQNQIQQLPQEPLPFQGFSASQQLPMGMLGNFRGYLWLLPYY